jgi:exopolysaccharide biosynthesis polyprenyl glycosylphosphotransferase
MDAKTAASTAGKAWDRFARPWDEIEVPVRVSREALPPSLITAIPSLTSEPRQAAAINVRRHILRDAVRVSALLAGDLAALLLVRVLHQALPAAWTAASDEDIGAAHAFLEGGSYGSAAFLVALVGALAINGCYGVGDRRRDPVRLLAAGALAAALPLWTRFWNAPLPVGAEFLYGVFVLTIALIGARLALDAVVRRRPLRTAAARTVLVGSVRDCESLICRRSSGIDDSFKVLGFEVVGVVEVGERGSEAALGGLSEIDRILREHRADTVVLCGRTDERTIARVVKAATVAECELLVADRAFEMAGVHPAVVWRSGRPLIELRAQAARGRHLVVKRVFDVVVTAAALVALAPLMLVIAAAVRLESPGPVFFGHMRAGRRGRFFRCFKFRSMYVDAEQRLRSDPELHQLYVENDFKIPPALDPRITAVGRWLRRTSLDELPQLCNVLRGDMSLVGPRPVVREELMHYAEEEPLLLSLRPGLTGLWQVNGRSKVAYPTRAHIELQYVQNWSMTSDIKILLRTIPSVLMQRGAF